MPPRAILQPYAVAVANPAWAVALPSHARSSPCGDSASGAIDFLHGDGSTVALRAGEGCFLPKHLRVKWVWPEATEYAVLCLPAFTPEGCGREAEENATNAKDSASMARLQKLHEQKAAA